MTREARRELEQRGPIAIDESIPNREVRRGGQLYGRVYGGECHRVRDNAPGLAKRKEKRKASRDARKRNRGR